MLRRAATALIAVATLFTLTGCLVTTKNLPAGATVIDDRLVGTWRGINEDGKDSDAFLHFIKQAPDKPLRLLWVEGDDFQIYDLTTIPVGKHHVFASMPVASPQNTPDPVPAAEGEYILGFYDVSKTEALFWLLDTEKVSALIKQGGVQGTVSDSAGGGATLTGTSDDVAKFLASEAAYAARGVEPMKLRRMSAPK
jgi:hypothetical protein